MHVILFDIDGTLISTNRAGSAAMSDALREGFGVDKAVDVPFAGRTDRAIIADLLTGAGCEASAENIRRFKECYLDFLQTRLAERGGRVLPGVVELLDLIAGRNDTVVGLLTGNLQEGARHKLSYFDLFDRFQFGGFGDEALIRDGVAVAAYAAACDHLGDEIPPQRVVVIGDTPLDVSCARHIGARAIAVATGQHRYEDLVDEKPDLLLQDLTAIDFLINWLEG